MPFTDPPPPKILHPYTAFPTVLCRPPAPPIPLRQSCIPSAGLAAAVLTHVAPCIQVKQSRPVWERQRSSRTPGASTQWERLGLMACVSSSDTSLRPELSSESSAVEDPYQHQFVLPAGAFMLL